MRVQVVATIITTVVFVGLLTGCGSDPDIGTHDSKAPASASSEIDLSHAAFVNLTGTAKPEVDALDNVFKAKFIEVKAGATVTFRNDGRNTHNVVPVEEIEFTGVEASAFEPGAEVAITFDEPGEFPYYCSLHGTTTKGMTGAIRVLK